MEDKNKIYQDHGCKDREEYLEDLADNYGVDPYVVHEIAGMLGESEDFDGLISELEDYTYLFGE